MDLTLSYEVDQICNLINTKSIGKSRILIAIAGPPASGKSTLAEAVVQCLNSGDTPRAALLPMDGYHLDNQVLETRGLLSRKGAPETFDAQGFCRAIHQLARQDGNGYYPIFDRSLDLAKANAIAISADLPVIVVEGNYLLLNSEPWLSLKDVFALNIFVSPGLEVLQERLHQRWINHGLDNEAALQRMVKNDLPNARLVVEQSREADLHIQQNNT